MSAMNNVPTVDGDVKVTMKESLIGKDLSSSSSSKERYIQLV